ncbi:UNKNOWN [Stylonychia lemnae]|uniref:THH1/TOM1/TOM3 domain-containing protein n=1 Tax=Stylonychia lemnae TaxID=5949 RepID=A0A078BEA3_STYLE|nr:UNKNOWN [Stylonychia lemnae]|eukprot:CDW91462.1 UNKNOWN [Stylonychia lemnae]
MQWEEQSIAYRLQSHVSSDLHFLLQSDQDSDNTNDKLSFIMILIGVFNFVFLCVSAHLVYKIQRLIKFTDIPQLLSITSIFLSIFFIGIYIVLFILYVRFPDNEYLQDSNIIRISNFIAVMFFSFALVFDLYKWMIFLVATKMYINPRKNIYVRNQRILLWALITAQLILLTIALVFITLMLIYDYDTDDEHKWEVTQNILDVQFYFVACLFFIILTVFIVVDVWLIRRLKIFYPSFYQRQKGQILLANFGTILSLSARLVINIVMTQPFYNELLNDSLDPIHQIISITLGFYLPIGAITYSLMYAFQQKKRLQNRQIQIKSQIGSPSLIEDEEMDDALFQIWDSGANDVSSDSTARYHMNLAPGLQMSIAKGQMIHTNSMIDIQKRGDTGSSILMPNPFEEKEDESKSFISQSDDL